MENKVKMIKEVRYTLIALGIEIFTIILGALGFVSFIDNFPNIVTFFLLMLFMAGIVVPIIFIPALWTWVLLNKIPAFNNFVEKVDDKVKSLFGLVVCVISAVIFGIASSGHGWDGWGYIALSAAFSFLGIFFIILFIVKIIKK